MGKITFTPLQQELFYTITQHPLLPKTFYFTGGTAPVLDKIEEFDYLPKMIKPLSLEELKAFFRQKAKEIGSRAVE